MPALPKNAASPNRARLLVTPIPVITSVPFRRFGDVLFTSSLMCMP
ncbi:Uncharacterised protein [Klebsiella pneumoniae]|nr:Uncharacterised protein [Klebsiella pneumoniae]